MWRLPYRWQLRLRVAWAVCNLVTLIAIYITGGYTIVKWYYGWLFS